MSVYFDKFRESFREIHSTGQRLVQQSLSPKDRALKEMMRFVLAYQKPSDYAHLFQYAFCRREGDFRRAVKIAAAVHLLQASSFVTDDIFDHSTRRYGHPAVHRKYGVSSAIVATELLQSVALETVSAELERGGFRNECRVLRIFNRMVRELYIGQYLDIYNTGNIRIKKDEYFRIIALGVGRFMAHVAECGALLAGKPAAEVRTLHGFGYHYGMALFITDDMVDVIDRPGVTGKSDAMDLRNRRMRLPVLLALERAAPREAQFLRALMENRRAGRAEIKRAREIIRRSGALEACLRAARRHLSSALLALSGIKPGPTTQNLRWLAGTLLAAQRLGPGSAASAPAK